MLADGINALGMSHFDPEEKVRRAQDSLEGELEPFVLLLLVLKRQLDEIFQAGYLLGSHRPPIGSPREALDPAANDIALRPFLLILGHGQIALPELGVFEGLLDDLVGSIEVAFQEQG